MVNVNKLLRLKLIQTKTYKNINIDNNFKIENVEHRLKKALQVIQKYHVNRKKILFLTQFFNAELNDLLKHTKHSVRNKNFHLAKNFYSKVGYHLIVIIGQQTNSTLVEKSYKKEIPIVFIENASNFLQHKLLYTVPGSFSFQKQKSKQNLFLVLLKSILKRPYVFKK